jgi:CBS domain-containing protein
MKTCEEMMTPNPACCLVTDKVFIIAQRMQSEDIGSIPVVTDYQNMKLIGIVTDRDLALRVVGASRDPINASVGEVMSINLITCKATDDVDVALKLMATHQIRRIPIVDDLGGVVGIIAQADVAIYMKDSSKVADVVEQISQPDIVTAE